VTGLCRVGLSAQDAVRLAPLARTAERYVAGTEVTPPRAETRRWALVISGWACEMRILADGRRQIFSFLLPGDPIEIAPGDQLGRRSIVALTRLEVIDAGPLLKEDAISERRAFHAALTTALERQRERLFDHLLRLGRLTAYQRVVDLLLELRDRLDEIGLVKSESFHFPLTQENIADSVGLSVVHVNRTLQQLRREGLLDIRSGRVTLLKPAQLRALTGCNEVTATEPSKAAATFLQEET
jgi:CRP-like cAMP-binding protein